MSRVEESCPLCFVDSCEIFFGLATPQLASAPGGFSNRKEGSEIVPGSFAYTTRRDA
jgi:hypothetical protein